MTRESQSATERRTTTGRSANTTGVAGAPAEAAGAETSGFGFADIGSSEPEAEGAPAVVIDLGSAVSTTEGTGAEAFDDSCSTLEGTKAAESTALADGAEAAGLPARVLVDGLRRLGIFQEKTGPLFVSGLVQDQTTLTAGFSGCAEISVAVPVVLEAPSSRRTTTRRGDGSWPESFPLCPSTGRSSGGNVGTSG